MKYISKLSAETIALLASIKEKDVAQRESKTHLDNVLATIKLPSGRTRNGGKKDLEDAQGKHNVLRESYWDTRKKLTAYLREDMMRTRRQHITESFTVMIQYARDSVVKDLLVAARNCFVEKEIQTIVVKGYSFDINCDISYDGLMVNVSPKGEGRSVCGGMLSVRRKHSYAYNREIEKTLETITSITILDDEMHVELPDEYRDGGYTISTHSHDNLEADYARVVVFLFDSCVDVANCFNSYVVESALAHSSYKVV